MKKLVLPFRAFSGLGEIDRIAFVGSFWSSLDSKDGENDDF